MPRIPVASAQSELPLSDPDHRIAYRQIRNFLAGQALGATRDRALLPEVVKMLLCKHFLDQQGEAPGISASDADLVRIYPAALSRVAERLPSILGDMSTFELDSNSLAFVHRAIAPFDLDDPRIDLIGDAFEAFTGTDSRGQEGQFFTPHNAVALLVELVKPQPGERIIDPACGAGGFLSESARSIMSAGADPLEAVNSVFGIDKDEYLARLASIRIAFFALSEPNIWCADSLGWRSQGDAGFPGSKLEGTFDVVLTNPPFGAKIVAATPEVQGGFDLGYQWKLSGGHFENTRKLQRSVPPQVLFIERCLSLARPGGRIGIVVPESLISGRNYRHVVAWLRERSEIRAVLGMPEALFKSSGKGGTHTKTCLVYLQKHEDKAPPAKKRGLFMAEVRWCGNDSRGRQTGRDELPVVAKRWAAHQSRRLRTSDHLGYEVATDNVIDDILAPRYYNPEIAAELSALADTHDLVRVSDLIDSGVIKITTGHEVGAAEYGSGPIPFVRTSDISNWEIKLDPKHGVSEEVYETYASRQDLREGDLFMVRDGTYLVGTCAYITKYDTRMVFQSHILKIRVTDHSKLSPYLLLAALTSAPVRRQVISKRFTQDIIDSLGNRVAELVLPLPKDPLTRTKVADMVKKSIDERVEARELARQACFEIIGRPTELPDDEIVG